MGLVPAVSLLCYGSTESDPVAYVVLPFKRRDGTIPLRPIRSPFERMTWLIALLIKRFSWVAVEGLWTCA